MTADMSSGREVTVGVPDEWGVYDAYCMKCAARWIAVAPITAESRELWECAECGAEAVTWHPCGDDEDGGE